MISDRSKIRAFRNRLVDAGTIDGLWSDLQQQLDARGLTIRRGVLQHATSITPDPGHATADAPRGEQARTRRTRDGTRAKKGKKSQFGFKLDTLIDKEWQLIRRVATTTASTHDSRINLPKPEEMVCRDRGYFGVRPPAPTDESMHRAVRGDPLSIGEKRRNRAISSTGVMVERP